MYIYHRQARNKKSQGGKEQENKNTEGEAKAQEPERRNKKTTTTGVKQKNRGKDTWKIATLNIRGIIAPGKRDEIEKWMKENGIEILLIQETRAKQNTKEARKTHTHGTSAEKKEEKNTQQEQGQS